MKAMHRSRAVKNSFWILAERILSVGIATIITVISARYLGTEDFGVLSYGLTFVALFTGVMKLGLDSTMVSELITHKRRQGEFLGTSMLLRLVSSVLSVISIGLLLLVLNSNQSLVITVGLIQSIMLIFQAFYILDFWFQSNLASKYVSIAKITATAVTGIYSVYLLATGKSVTWFAVSTVLTSIVVAVTLFILYKKQGGQRLYFSSVAAKYLLANSYHFIIASIISLVYVQIDKVMIGNILNQHELGLYSAALLLCTAWAFLPDAIITSLRPGVMRAKKENEVLYLSRLKRMYFIIFWISTAVAGFITIVTPFVIPILFGEEFKESVIIAQVAVWYMPFSVLGIARNVWTVSENNHKYPKYYLAHGLILNVGLNLILIPTWGIMGAAISTILTELMTCFISPLFYRRTRIHTKIVLEAILYRLETKEI